MRGGIGEAGFGLAGCGKGIKGPIAAAGGPGKADGGGWESKSISSIKILRASFDILL